MTHPLLTAPTLPQAVGNGINALAAAHLQVDIPPYPGMDEGDLIELFWNNCFAASRRITTGKIGEFTHLRVPESFVLEGPTQVHYQVMQVGHGPARSAVTRVRVKTLCPGGQPSPLCGDENQNLAPVGLPDIIRRYGVNASQVRRGIPLTIEPYLHMTTGDAITLRWGDVRLDLPKIRAREVGLAVQVWVPSTVIIEAGDDCRLEVTYCILDRVGNNSRWAPARTLRIAAGAQPRPAGTALTYQPRALGSPCEPG
ncbi:MULTISPECIES: hypothetical protein [Pseudomonas]|jgi:hypothetical protein|uniref:Uncharacterized protein n=1 Tax=Pseudomonas extremorientalis TaxID=169669 RepID=A0A1H0TJL1_9PSED|nr:MULTISPECIES: hypothetical protein [Pseudomonas]KAB0520402.1 hypothetical protein F7R08_08265 [Pseudomonas extremorientalis]OIN04231.1 hypothetical protein BFN10_28420 [Pseudomonas extremorientalis]QZP21531.1 hypothetical protein K5K89_02020 [Pseudomonas sp. DR208]UUN89028.1 hypothetical protein LUU92_01160 [Pseudomonas extremorientalis]SDP54005.1 hypothetical protein SAMN04490184_3750 [Pseudomonas extremorientalis]